MARLNYAGEERRAIKVLVRPRCEFPSVFKVFNAIRYPTTGVADEQISFAILELVSNSMRAHKERGCEEAIIVRLWIEGNFMMIRVSDQGGGFDPSRLPYSLSAPVDSLHLMAPEFIAYRERYGNTRFGMGLVAVRRIFPLFSLKFVDASGKELVWPSVEIAGTTIILGISIRP